jgi:hypothetical protein
MRYPENPSRDRQRTLDRDDDLAAALALLRRAMQRQARTDVEGSCRGLLRRLAAAALPADDRAEVVAVVELLMDRVKYGLSQRLRKLLLPLVAAIETQMEICE